MTSDHERAWRSCGVALLGAVALATACGSEAPTAKDDSPATVQDTDTPAAPTPWGPWGRRLSVRELRYVLADLVGDDPAAAIVFPEEETLAGFDALREVGAVGDVLVDRWDAASSLAADRLALQLVGASTSVPVEAGAEVDCTVEASQAGEAPWSVLWTDQVVSHAWSAPSTGRYHVEFPFRLHAAPSFDLAASLDGVPIGELALTTVNETNGDVGSPGLWVEANQGLHTITWSLVNPPDVSSILPELRCVSAGSLAYRSLSVFGPVADTMASCTDVPACAADAGLALARRVWSSAEEDVDAAALLRVSTAADAEGGGLSDATASVLHAVLLSPRTLLVEDDAHADADPDLGSFALARRLALLAWSSVPDEALLACAARDGLRDPADAECSMTAQLDRMLDDPRAQRLLDGFATQWLRLPASVPTAPPDQADAPMSEIKASMRAEAIGFLQASFQGGDPVNELLFAPVRSTPAALTAWYATAGETSATAREGLLALGGVHVATAPTGRASAVLRGVWTRDVLLCDPPGAPPPNVPMPQLSGDEQADVETIDEHVASPECATCHASIDPIGHALLGWDGWGRPRVSPGTPRPLPDGTLLTNPNDVAAWIADSDRFDRCLTAAVGTYAIGRRVDARTDAAWIDAWLAQTGSEGHTLRAILRSLVASGVLGRRGSASP